MNKHYAVVIIGAGPAGMATAQVLTAHDVEVMVADEQSQPGGQIYKNAANSPLEKPGMLGKDYMCGERKVLGFLNSSAEFHTNTRVWYLDSGRTLGILKNGASYQLRADKVVIATGAQERPTPLPGWQLPGVMTAGAGQILLKSAAMVANDGVVLAGNGPLLLLLAWQYLNAGVSIQAILETSDKSNRTRALRHLPRALLASEYLYKGINLLRAIHKAGVPIYKRVSELSAHGVEKLERVQFVSDGKHHLLQSGLLLLHQGVVPDLYLAQAADCGIVWNESQQCWHSGVDEWGQTSQDGIFVAGDGASIVGAIPAELSGRLTGLQILQQLGKIDSRERNQLANPIRRKLNRHLSVRPFLDAYYHVANHFLSPPDDTIVCRCEEVTAGEIRQLTRLGCMGPNQAKSFSRCGMGPCQGRFCGNTVEQIMAHALGQSVRDIGRFRVRPPIKPVTLGQVGDTQ